MKPANIVGLQWTKQLFKLLTKCEQFSKEDIVNIQLTNFYYSFNLFKDYKHTLAAIQKNHTPYIIKETTFEDAHFCKHEACEGIIFGQLLLNFSGKSSLCYIQVVSNIISCSHGLNIISMFIKGLVLTSYLPIPVRAIACTLSSIWVVKYISTSKICSFNEVWNHTS